MKKNRGLKTRTSFSNSIDNKLAAQLEEVHQNSKIPKSKLLDKAISLLLEDPTIKQYLNKE